MSTLLIVSTCVCAFGYIIPMITKYIVSWLFSESYGERVLRSEMKKLEHEMLTISMVDEFAKYTKIQRKHTKLGEEFKNQMSIRMSSRAKAQLFFTYATKFFNSIVLMALIKMYRAEPVIIFPQGTLWPLSNFMSWPGVYEDSISMMMWIAITTCAISTCKENFF